MKIYSPEEDENHTLTSLARRGLKEAIGRLEGARWELEVVFTHTHACYINNHLPQGCALIGTQHTPCSPRPPGVCCRGRGVTGRTPRARSGARPCAE